MKIIIPMAGMGKRLRPHTLTVPKPLIRIAGKTIVNRLVEDIVSICNERVEEISFVVRDFGKDVECMLISVAEKMGAKGRIFHQDVPLGTAHAIMCAEESLTGKVIIAFADTLFKAEFRLDESKEAVIWTHKVNNPSLFGVVITDENNIITSFAEKPQTFVSDQAIIGIYYFNDGDRLKNEIRYLIDSNFKVNGEFQLTDVLQNMMHKGCRFSTETVTEWLDCGNKEATLHTHQRILEFNKNSKLIDDSFINKNSLIIPPCYIGKNVEINNSVIGPYVSVENDTCIRHSMITNSIIESQSQISNCNIQNSMIGNNVVYRGDIDQVSIGDYTSIFRSAEPTE